MNAGLAYTVKHIQKGLTLLTIQDCLVPDNLRPKTQREENNRTLHLTNAPDPEDIQRELYGDW